MSANPHDAFGFGDEAHAEQAKREFLTCRLGDELYGIDILRVQEIRGVEQVTRVPGVAPFVRGVINLRGAIVPIVDLGLMFGFPEPLVLADASAVVLNGGRRLVGLVVNAVSDVVALTDEQIAPAPDFGNAAVGAALAGIGRHEDQTLLLLDVEHLLARIREGRERT
ncbi:chemotaxis protein CheW [Usitatibacter palustris]|uniref:Chemotaxis protein CheW n=1 Tax=Usitatibacter palustris TaxID=2732487 RepID=A0A6M4H861_9PROT|nr:chemotaxis protein CheW [Usitatibacter palustris]QJR15038.1 Chemotaxis protein CheW [Usitatibacter palustris]